jgi:hypothetical protein
LNHGVPVGVGEAEAAPPALEPPSPSALHPPSANVTAPSASTVRRSRKKHSQSRKSRHCPFGGGPVWLSGATKDHPREHRVARGHSSA